MTTTTDATTWPGTTTTAKTTATPTSPTPLTLRHVVDVTVNDPDWEDEVEGTLPGLGTTMHRSRNPHLPVNPRRKMRRRVVAGLNVRATAARRRKEGLKRLDELAVDLDTWEVEREERMHELAEKHGMKPKEVRRRMLSLSTYGARHRPSTYNAKISRIMADLNESREDPSMLEGFSKEEEKEMVKAILNKRERKTRGTRANNLAAAADAKRTMDRLMIEKHVGMIGFAMFSRAHVHNKSLPVTIQSWGALDFFLEVLKRDPTDVSTLFELWAVSRERVSIRETNKNKLLAKQQEATGIITTGLQKILGVTKCAMTYEGYIEKLVRGKGVGRPSAHWRSCWTPSSVDNAVEGVDGGENQKLIEQYEEMVRAGRGQGEVGEDEEGKVEEGGEGTDHSTKRKRSTRNEEAGEDDNDEAPARMTAAKPKRRSKPCSDDNGPPVPKAAAKPKHPAEPSVRDDESGEDDDDELPVRKTAAKAKRRTKLSVPAEDSGEDDEDEPPAQKTVAKRKRPSLPSQPIKLGFREKKMGSTRQAFCEIPGQ
ncbi:hypothetical protein B0H14DRAFT_3444755 [Mycena olivaceomarginata]|nr:hypothetical protein B0H14DRAFT_3444755 [Mycena olivaceomarginata]